MAKPRRLNGIHHFTGGIIERESGVVGQCSTCMEQQLRERFGIPDSVYGGLLVYAALATVLPSLLLSRPVDFDLLPDPPHHEPPTARPAATTT